MLRSFIQKAKKAKFFRDERGANAVEFALVCLPMAILTIAIIEVGALFFAYNDLHNAAREGARRLAVEDGITYGDGTPAGFGGWETGSTFTCDGL